MCDKKRKNANTIDPAHIADVGCCAVFEGEMVMRCRRVRGVEDLAGVGPAGQARERAPHRAAEALRHVLEREL